jgi:hypothetical protein
MPVIISINSCREGILTMGSDIMTIITDQQITVVDVIHSDLHRNKDNFPIDIHVDDVIETRPSRGNWKNTPPIGIK